MNEPDFTLTPKPIPLAAMLARHAAHCEAIRAATPDTFVDVSLGTSKAQREKQARL